MVPYEKPLSWKRSALVQESEIHPEFDWNGKGERYRKVTCGTPKAQVLGWSMLKRFANGNGTNTRVAQYESGASDTPLGSTAL